MKKVYADENASDVQTKLVTALVFKYYLKLATYKDLQADVCT